VLKVGTDEIEKISILFAFSRKKQCEVKNDIFERVNKQNEILQTAEIV